MKKNKSNPFDYPTINEEYCQQLIDRIQSIVSIGNRSEIALTIKAAVWVCNGTLSQADLENCLESIWRVQPRNPCNYFCVSLRNRMGLKSKAEMNDLIRQTPIPRFAMYFHSDA